MSGLDVEKALNELPDQIADALEAWRVSTLNREKCEALLYAKFKGQDTDRSAAEIKSMINSDDARYSAALVELKLEANYQRLYERLMCAKKIAQMRIAI